MTKTDALQLGAPPCAGSAVTEKSRLALYCLSGSLRAIGRHAALRLREVDLAADLPAAFVLAFLVVFRAAAFVAFLALALLAVLPLVLRAGLAGLCSSTPR